jgi:uncharacterized cofD-like protein
MAGSFRKNGKSGKVPHVVCIGAGTGQAALLKGLISRGCRVTAIVGVTDNGGHSGVLRRELGIPQVGDSRNCLAALCPEGSLEKALLEHRFSDGGLSGANLGNIILAALTQSRGSLSAALGALCSRLCPPHRVLPVSDGNSQVCAELSNGRTIVGEWETISRRPRSPIARISHRPRLAAMREATGAVREADMLVICPGSLFTGIASVLAADGMGRAVRDSTAPLVHVCNIMTQPGQTDGFCAGNHVDAMERCTGRLPDFVLINAGIPAKGLLRLYAAQGSEPVNPRGARAAACVISADLVEKPKAAELKRYARSGTHVAGPHFIRHDAAKTAALLTGLPGGPPGSRACPFRR